MFTKLVQKDIFILYQLWQGGRSKGVRKVAQSRSGSERSERVARHGPYIPAGSDFHVEIGVALKSCRALIPVLTRKYVQSRYCKGELYVAYDEKKAILPVVYENGWDGGKEGAGVNYTVKAF